MLTTNGSVTPATRHSLEGLTPEGPIRKDLWGLSAEPCSPSLSQAYNSFHLWSSVPKVRERLVSTAVRRVRPFGDAPIRSVCTTWRKCEKPGGLVQGRGARCKGYRSGRNGP